MSSSDACAFVSKLRYRQGSKELLRKQVNVTLKLVSVFYRMIEFSFSVSLATTLDTEHFKSTHISSHKINHHCQIWLSSINEFNQFSWMAYISSLDS
jgi:hypothetical protein